VDVAGLYSSRSIRPSTHSDLYTFQNAKVSVMGSGQLSQVMSTVSKSVIVDDLSHSLLF
jgi:hypothetical protein